MRNTIKIIYFKDRYTLNLMFLIKFLIILPRVFLLIYNSDANK